MANNQGGGKPPSKTPTSIPPKPPVQSVVAKNPVASNYKYGTRSIYGTHIPLDRGYAVKFPTSDPKANNANGKLTDQLGREIYFWIEEMSAQIQMNGSTGQSQSVRQFFPRNMTQPSFTIVGRMPDSYKYNVLAAFVRESQWLSKGGRTLKQQVLDGQAVAYNNYSDAGKTGLAGDSVYIPTIRLEIAGRLNNGSYNSVGNRNFKPPSESNDASGTTQKGRNRSWTLDGYIRNMQAGAKRFDPAPQFSFEFLVSQVKDGAWTDEEDTGRGLEILSWAEQFANRPMNGFEQLGDSKKDKDKDKKDNK